MLIQELERARRNDDPAAIFQAVVEAVWQNLELPLSRIILVAPGTVLRTSSGKIQRLANRRAFMDGELPVIAQWERQAPVAAPPALKQQACAAAPDAEALAAWLQGWLAERLNLPIGTVDVRHGFAELGLDSLASTEMAFALSERLGTEVPETIAFDYPTIARLVAHIAGRPLELPQTGSAAASVMARPDAKIGTGTELDELLTAIEKGDL